MTTTKPRGPDCDQGYRARHGPAGFVLVASRDWRTITAHPIDTLDQHPPDRVVGYRCGDHT